MIHELNIGSDPNATNFENLVRLGSRKPERLLTALRLLVVGGGWGYQQRAASLLSQQGALIQLATDRGEAVSETLTAKPSYDLILIDLQMAKMAGYATALEIRKHFDMETLPVIGMTIFWKDRDLEIYGALGINDLIGKSFDVTEVVATILLHVQRKVARSFGRAIPCPVL